ncbi:hypothetical protein [Pseudarthrobacter sp. 1C304]|uniref:hypothetical protein n=1 Tax=Pseudarthrobacter sp. 1C304 TaxID=3457438 RepID=UPI003FD58D21
MPRDAGIAGIARPSARSIFPFYRGITVRPFVDPAKSHRVGLLVQVPGMETFQRMMACEEASEARKYDGVRPDTNVTLVEP